MRELYNYIKENAQLCGFDLCGIVPASRCSEQTTRLQEWIGKGHHASMAWIEQNIDKREDPSLLVDGAKCVIVCGVSYLTINESPLLSSYALGTDYHYVIKDMLTRLATAIEQKVGHSLNYRVFCDSAPVLERHWAQQAGLGWIGRSTMLVNKELGSYVLLGEIVVDLELDKYDIPSDFNGCGSCQKCVDSCPSKAISSDGVDCHKCAAYLTVEHPGEFTPQQQEVVAASAYVFGCDICMRVCPWNTAARARLTSKMNSKAEDIFAIDMSLLPLSLDQWQELVESGFKQRMRSRAPFRTGKKRIARNIAALKSRQ